MTDKADIIGRLDTIDEQLSEIRTATLLGSKQIYTTSEACLFLGVKRSYLYELVRNQKIPYFKSRGGKLTYFKRTDLEEWMTDNNFPMSQDE